MNLRKQSRGPRFLKGEKRGETVKAKITYSELLRTDAAAAASGVARSLYVATAIRALNDLVEAGAAPMGPMEHWQQVARSTQASLAATRDAIDRQITALGVICNTAQ